MDKIKNWISVLMDGWMAIYETDQQTFVAIGLIIGVLCVLLWLYVMWLSIQRLHIDVSDKLWWLLMLLGIVMVLAWLVIFFSFTLDTLNFYI